MPLINLEYDDSVVTSEEAHGLSNAIRDIISSETDIKDVFVYGNTAEIKVQVAPIEIFVRMSAKIDQDDPKLMERIKNELQQWKTKNNFSHAINLTLIPMDWQIEIGI